jgi:predicted nucleic acid-binding protein
MILVDTNIVIYSYLPEYSYLKSIIFKENTFISEISRVEVLGYPKLKQDEDVYFQNLFRFLTIIFPSQEIYDAAIEVRKKHNLKLGDSIIAATAMVQGLTIYSRNLKDFENVVGLKCFNPIRQV